MSGAVPADLGPLMSFIDKKFEFTNEKYPPLAELREHIPRMMFMVQHSHQHMSKTTGKVASVCEVYGHSGKVDVAALCDAVAGELATVLKLACVLGMTSQDLVDAVVDKVAGNPANTPRRLEPLAD